LEAELVRRYQPRYNILLRDDKSLQYVRISYKSDYPTVSLIRRPLDDGAEYFGPYVNSQAIKKALRYLRRAFPYATQKPMASRRVNLHYHLGMDPGLEEGRTSLKDYRANLRKLMRYLKGQGKSLIKDIEKDMKQAAQRQDFEKAAVYRNQLRALQQLSQQILFSDRELQDASKDQALLELATLLGLKTPPRRIEGFDISHMQGTDTVASMVVFINGLPDKASYRKFKMRAAGNDDFLHIKETISRRLSQKNAQKWGLADLVLIDGGKGQLTAAISARNDLGHNQIPFIGLAKKQEEIIIQKNLSLTDENDISSLRIRAQSLKAYIKETADFIILEIPQTSHMVKLVQRIRDEAHRFAVSYHSTLKQNRQTRSILDEIPGVGDITRKKLIRHFGSTRAVIAASPSEIQSVLGKNRGAQISRYLISYK
jgi:excinuclease ABC subunit C